MPVLFMIYFFRLSVEIVEHFEFPFKYFSLRLFILKVGQRTMAKSCVLFIPFEKQTTKLVAKFESRKIELELEFELELKLLLANYLQLVN